MSVAVITFANLGRKRNLKTIDILPVLDVFAAKGELRQVICQLHANSPYPRTVSAVPRVVRLVLGMLRRFGYPRPRSEEEAIFDFFAPHLLVHSDVTFFHGGYFLIRTTRKARESATICIDLAVAAHPQTNARLEREEYTRLGITSLEGSYARIERESVHSKKFDYVIAMSEFARKTYLAAGFSSDKVFFAAPDIDCNRFSPQRQATNDLFNVLYIAHTQPLKGLHYVLDAWEQISLPQAQFTVIGGFSGMPKELEEQYMNRMHALGIEYIRSTEEPERYFRSASVFVFPSLTEGFGRVTLEAMACGIPVITTENARGIVEDGKTGFVVPIRDSDALAEKMRYLYEHQDEAVSMGNEARKAVLAKKPFGDAVYEIYQDILKREQI